ncbi:MAG: ATP phosphoribosyltransferase regulatory subunit [Candidatus Pacebacteria bacterium]|nr:ATP phosphoribosyltransferase regulatory subunit [Candidatus Paceibacterota bacterium]
MSQLPKPKPGDWRLDNFPSQPLLPAGLSDLLPPESTRRAATVERILAGFANYGFERVDPPLVEFEETLLPTGQERLNEQSFRLLDPVSRRQLAVRADLTTQVARIATSRLRSQPRPLRLAYAGDVLRVTASQLRPARQIFEIGAELLGSDQLAADIEIMRLAVESLSLLELGVPLSLDLCFSQLVPELLGQLAPNAARLKIAEDRDYKNYFMTKPPSVQKYLPLIQAIDGATGDAQAAVGKLEAISRELAGMGSAAAAAMIEQIIAQINQIRAILSAEFSDLSLTVDLIENRGFDYDGSLGFSVYGRGIVGELARGGRYVAVGIGYSEPATGMTIFFDSLLNHLPQLPLPRRILIPHDLAKATVDSLHQQGFVTIAHLSQSKIDAEVARHQNCGHYWSPETAAIIAINPDPNQPDQQRKNP